jgi:hypothetical protein
MQYATSVPKENLSIELFTHDCMDILMSKIHELLCGFSFHLMQQPAFEANQCFVRKHRTYLYNLLQWASSLMSIVLCR